MRKPPEIEVPPVAPQDNQKYIKEVRRYKVITPLFGGGVEPGTADPITIVRATEVRGQLRFWWRACRGRKGTLAALKEAEDNLWGAASTPDKPRPSEVQIAVTTLERGKPLANVQVRDREVPVSAMNSPYGYGAFPLQDKPGATLREGVMFELEITYPADKETADDIRASLWAWETFGGIGARTRRGFGALQLTHVNGEPKSPPSANNAEREILAGLANHVEKEGAWPIGIPHLQHSGPQLRVLKAAGSPPMILRALLAKLKAFRQYRTGRFGRSYWPEPDAIRRRTRAARRHATPITTVDKFPRAAFGLPIVFHFKDEREGDPPTTILQGAKVERLASPLILKPVACANDQAVGLAMILSTPLAHQVPGGLTLKGATKPLAIDTQLTAADANDIAGLDGRVDVLQAFLDDLENL